MLDWISGLIGSAGVAGIAFLMFAENVFPPIPSELIMPLAGFQAALGRLGLGAVIAAGSAGSLAGAVFWYSVGRYLGAERLTQLTRKHGRWLAVTPQDIERSAIWFQRHGRKAVLVGRLIPTVRTFISVPAGIALMPLGVFLVYSAVGTVVWTTLLTLAGYWLQAQYARIADWMDPVSTVILAGILGLYLWRVATYRQRLDISDAANSETRRHPPAQRP